MVPFENFFDSLDIPKAVYNAIVKDNPAKIRRELTYLDVAKEAKITRKQAVLAVKWLEKKKFLKLKAGNTNLGSQVVITDKFCSICGTLITPNNSAFQTGVVIWLKKRCVKCDREKALEAKKKFRQENPTYVSRTCKRYRQKRRLRMNNEVPAEFPIRKEIRTEYSFANFMKGWHQYLINKEALKKDDTYSYQLEQEVYGFEISIKDYIPAILDRIADLNVQLTFGENGKHLWQPTSEQEV